MAKAKRPSTTTTVPNLDCEFTEPHELRAWAYRHDGTTCTVKQAAERLFPDGAPAAQSVTMRLAAYAHNKACAMENRALGNIAGALFYEKYCEQIYAKLPEWARW